MNQNQSNRITLSLPVLLLMILVFVVIGGAIAYVGLQQADVYVEPTDVPPPTMTPTMTLTPTLNLPTSTPTPFPSPTAFTHIVKEGEFCSTIAYFFDVSSQAIINANPEIGQDCILYIGQEVRVPQPTATNTPAPTATPNEAQMTRLACTDVRKHTVQENESMSLIEASYEVPSEQIMKWNNLTSDGVWVGQTLEIPMCYRTFSGGATVTPTIAPPYPKTELLLPKQGASYDGAVDVVLQWSSVGELRSNEHYQVTVVDLTSGKQERFYGYSKETNFTLPESLRPTDELPHVFQWFVVPVAQIGADVNGDPFYTNGGPVSDTWVFTWTGE